MANLNIFVGAIIENERKEFLLQKRDTRASTFKKCWTIFGGTVKKGENPKKALLRELKEELSLTPKNILSCKLIQKNTQPNGSIQYVYLVKTKATIKDLYLKEGSQMKYVKQNDLFKRKFAFNILNVFKEYLKSNNHIF